MEEFKIINLKTAKKDEEYQEENIEVEEDIQDEYVPPKKRYIVIPIILVLALAALLVVMTVVSYKDYETENSWVRNDALESNYYQFKNNLIKYSSDGIFYTTYSGTLIWNYTYNMTTPVLDASDNYLVVYDKKGNEIDIFSQSGYVNTIISNTPIIKACIANQGTVAVMSQEAGVTYIQMYNTKGVALVSGEIHPENKGYPIAMDISSNATKLAISIINLNDGNITTDLIFYDFSSAGREKEDNIVATYKYIDMLIPEVKYMSGDKAVAFGENQITIFNNNSNVTVEKEIYINEEIKSIITNDSFIGYVTEEVGEYGTIDDRLTIYNLFGLKRLSKVLPDSYDRIDILSNDEIAVFNNEHIYIYNLFGINKFEYEFSENIYAIIPGHFNQRYFLIKETETEEISLK